MDAALAPAFCPACFSAQMDPFHRGDVCPLAALAKPVEPELVGPSGLPANPFADAAFAGTLLAAETKEAVYHPPHYARWAMEPIEFIAINNLPWWVANVIKYTMRFDAKDGLQDLYKARSYLDMKIKQLEGHPRFWDKPVTDERKANGVHTQ